MKLVVADIVLILFISLCSCVGNNDKLFDSSTQEVNELRDEFWQTGDTINLHRGLLIVDSLLKGDLSQNDYLYCEKLKEQIYIDMGKIKQAMILREQIINPKDHPEDYYEFMAVLAFCNDELEKMQHFSQKASIEFDKLAKNSYGKEKEDFLQRFLDTSILCRNYPVADSLFNILKNTVSKSHYDSFEQYYLEERSHLDELKRQYKSSAL
jgi:hypothetical protein